MARLLLVEDNPANLELMAYLMRAFGHDVEPFTDAEAALQRAFDEPFDLVLCDVLMPRLDGYEFAKRFKAHARGAHTPLVAVTALAMVGDRETILAAGFDGYVPKPIDPEHFVPTIQAFIHPSAGESPATVLAVDDIAINLDVIEHTLRPFGFRVLRALSVRDAIRLLDGERPDVILSDIHMPMGDGFGLIEWVKARDELRDVPFIFLSSTVWQTSDKQRALALGAHTLIVRPIEPEAFVEVVRAAIGQRSPR